MGGSSAGTMMSVFGLWVFSSFFVLSLFLFFFSSRRRHTRCSRDLSSDVCSSDLVCQPTADIPAQPGHCLRQLRRTTGRLAEPEGNRWWLALGVDDAHLARLDLLDQIGQIGRASCRERV